jgi:hypothetical protein
VCPRFLRAIAALTPLIPAPTMMILLMNRRFKRQTLNAQRPTFNLQMESSADHVVF